MLHYQNVNEVSEATGDQTSEIPLTENHHGIGQNFMLPVRLPVLGLHGKKMPSFNCNCQCFFGTTTFVWTIATITLTSHYSC